MIFYLQVFAGYALGVAFLGGIAWVGFLILAEVFSLPRDFARSYNKVAREERGKAHAEALAAGFTLEELAGIDRQSDEVKEGLFKTLKNVALFILVIVVVPVAGFAILGPFGIIPTFTAWAGYWAWIKSRYHAQKQ